MNKPKIRFKGFEGEWKEMQFEVAFEYQRNNSLSRSELSDEGIVANIHYGDVLIKYGECLDVSKDVLTYVKDKKISMALYKKGALRNGDVIFADAAEDNTVGKCTEVICEENVCIVSGLHTIACRPQVEIVERYLGYSLNSPSFHNQLLPHIQGTKISSISKNALSSTSISLPSLPEQRAIASYFTSLDAQIAASTSRLSSLKQIKAASLLNMFPQKGETVPRVRFKGFQGEWEERKLGEIAIVNPKCDLPKSFEYVDLESVVGTEMKSHRREFRESAPSRAQRLARKGDIFYQTVRPYQKNNYLFNLDYSDYVFSSGYAQIQALKDERFLFTVVQSDYFLKQVMDNCTGTSFPSINPTLLRNLIVYDCSIDEQRAIGRYFTALDAQITLHRERLEKLKQIKAACLEKMFA